MLRLLALLFVFWPVILSADAWDALREPDTVAIMRHALAPGTGDPAQFQLGDCDTQRNLDQRGQQQAQRIGAALKDEGIVFDRVLTSEWCRTRETATLLDSGSVVTFSPLNSFFQDVSTRTRQTAAVRDFLNTANGKLMLVTHQVNISALTGQGTRPGEILVCASQILASGLSEASLSTRKDRLVANVRSGEAATQQ